MTMLSLLGEDQLATRARLKWATGQGARALGLYLLVSILFFGLPLLRHFGHRFIGGRADPLIAIWALAWWPHALMHGLPAVLTPAVWAPGGYNLAWTTSLPGPSLLLSPITGLFGPVVSYNLLCLVSPALAAWSMFILCRYLTGQFWPPMVAGYIFGFSQYMLAHLLGHVFLLLIFPVPVGIYLVLLRLNQQISRTAFMAGLAILLWFEFSSSTELFATTAAFGAAALILSGLIYRAPIARTIATLALELGGAYLVAGLLAAPYLYYVFAGGVPSPINPSISYSNDLLAFAVPTRVLYAGRAFVALAHRFSRVESAAYLGPGVWIVLALYLASCWSSGTGKFLILSLMLAGLMSLGPELHIGGIVIGPAPWRLFSGWPLIDQALPARFGMYFFLVAAVITALYLSRPLPLWSKALLSSICLLSLAPNLGLFQSAITHVRVPQFFRTGEYKSYLARNDNILVLPFATREDGLLWQVETDFYFRLAAARLTLPTAEALGWPVLQTLYSGDEILDFSAQLQAFIAAHTIKAIIVDARTPEPWQRLLGDAGLASVKTGEVLYYRVTPPLIARYRGATARAMAQREAMVSFSTLVNGAACYLAAGFPPAALNPWRAKQLNMIALPGEEPAQLPADVHWWRNLWLGSWGEWMVGIGIEGDYDNLQPLVEKYQAEATDIFFPFPQRLVPGRERREGQLLITFTPDALRRAASKTSRTSGVTNGSCSPHQLRRPAGAPAK